MKVKTNKKKRKSMQGKNKEMPETCNPFSFLAEKKKNPVQFRLGVGLLSWIDNHAQEFNMTRSAVVLQALIEYAGKVEGIKEARTHVLLEQLKKSIPDQIRLTPVPDDSGCYTMDIVKAGVIRLDGEEGPQERKE